MSYNDFSKLNYIQDSHRDVLTGIKEPVNGDRVHNYTALGLDIIMVVVLESTPILCLTRYRYRYIG